VSDLRQLFDDSIRFEIELWNAVDARLQPGEVLTSRIEASGTSARPSYPADRISKYDASE
jgi:hypothetical protein